MHRVEILFQREWWNRRWFSNKQTECWKHKINFEVLVRLLCKFQSCKSLSENERAAWIWTSPNTMELENLGTTEKCSDFN